MTTRMEMVAEGIALEALPSVGLMVKPPLSIEDLEESFRARWPLDSSRFPISDAMDAALVAALGSKGEAPSAWDQETGSLKTTVVEAWDRAASGAVKKYLDNAQVFFEEAGHLEGAETLTDAVRTALGYIAARRGWPHGTDDDIYRTAAALAIGGNFPNDDDSLYDLLDGASDEGMDLCGALGATMGRPDSIRFGLYGDGLESVEEDAGRFAKTAIELALRLATEGTVAG